MHVQIYEVLDVLLLLMVLVHRDLQFLEVLVVDHLTVELTGQGTHALPTILTAVAPHLQNTFVMELLFLLVVLLLLL